MSSINKEPNSNTADWDSGSKRSGVFSVARRNTAPPFEKVAVSQTVQDGIWLCNHDAYIAPSFGKLCCYLVGDLTPAEGIYSIYDLTMAGQIAQTYKFSIEHTYDGGQNGAQLALNLAFADMQERL